MRLLYIAQNIITYHAHIIAQVLHAKVNNMQIIDVVIDVVGLESVEFALMILKRFLKQRPMDVTPPIQNMNTLKGYRRLTCSRILSNQCKFILALRLDER